MNTFEVRGVLMAQAKPTRAEQMQTAAEWRAKGAGWVQVAREMGIDARTLRRWRKSQPEEWKACLERAEADIVTEALGEAISALRKQLRNDAPADVCEAAKQLLGFRVQLLRLMKRLPGEEAATLDALLEGIAHDFGQTTKATSRIEKDGPRSAA